MILNYRNLIKEQAGIVNFNSDFDTIEFANRLVKEMINNYGICLTGPQIGVNIRVLAMKATPNLVCYNPRIVNVSDEKISLEETDLSWPGLVIKVKRPTHCRVRFTLPNGEVKTETYTGMTSRIFQHCMDILDGKTFFEPENTNYVHRQIAFRKWYNYMRKNFKK